MALPMLPYFNFHGGKAPTRAGVGTRVAMGGALIALTVILLSGCQRSETRHSATLEQGALMLLPFPGWQSGGDASIQSVDLSALAPKDAKASSSPVRAEVAPAHVVKLNEKHAVLLTETWPIGEGNVRLDCHACSGTLGAYFFEHDADGWRLTARQDAVAYSGVSGSIGETSVAKLEDGHYAATAEWGSCWQGYCGSWLVVVGLQPGQATLLSNGIPMSVDNDGAHGACSALDEPKDKSRVDETGDHECLDIQSKWKFQGRRLLVNFEGRLSDKNAGGKPGATKKIRQQAVYEVAGGQLTLLEGTNPVPGF